MHSVEQIGVYFGGGAIRVQVGVIGVARARVGVGGDEGGLLFGAEDPVLLRAGRHE